MVGHENKLFSVCKGILPASPKLSPQVTATENNMAHKSENRNEIHSVQPVE
jgi:hypothetical protein